MAVVVSLVNYFKLAFWSQLYMWNCGVIFSDSDFKRFRDRKSISDHTSKQLMPELKSYPPYISGIYSTTSFLLRVGVLVLLYSIFSCGCAIHSHIYKEITCMCMCVCLCVCVVFVKETGIKESFTSLWIIWEDNRDPELGIILCWLRVWSLL